VEHITDWVQTATGMELRPDGTTQFLDTATWRDRRQRLKNLGGPPL
jgi:hypothetical protein